MVEVARAAWIRAEVPRTCVQVLPCLRIEGTGQLKQKALEFLGEE